MWKYTELPSFVLRPLLTLCVLLALSRVRGWPFWLLMPLTPILIGVRSLTARTCSRWGDSDAAETKECNASDKQIAKTGRIVASDKVEDVEAYEVVSMNNRKHHQTHI